jgi:hypothetical protein
MISITPCYVKFRFTNLETRPHLGKMERTPRVRITYCSANLSQDLAQLSGLIAANALGAHR